MKTKGSRRGEETEGLNEKQVVQVGLTYIFLGEGLIVAQVLRDANLSLSAGKFGS